MSVLNKVKSSHSQGMRQELTSMHRPRADDFSKRCPHHLTHLPKQSKNSFFISLYQIQPRRYRTQNSFYLCLWSCINKVIVIKVHLWKKKRLITKLLSVPNFQWQDIKSVIFPIAFRDKTKFFLFSQLYWGMMDKQGEILKSTSE